MNVTIKVILLCIILLSALGKPQLVHGQSDYSTMIDATVKISICGNEVIEGGEDCEGLNLNGKSCTSLGYSGGELSCDIACTFDVTECIVPSPTPTPTPTSTSTPTPTSVIMPTMSTSPTTTDQPLSQEVPLAPTSRSIFRFFPSSQIFTETRDLLPPPLQVFDFYGAGKLFMQDISDIVKMWVKDWRLFVEESFGQGTPNTKDKSCDLNNDQICDLEDFSILMYYFERE